MKRFISAILLCLVLLSPAEAQVIILESDQNHNRAPVEGEVPFIPSLGVTYDQYAPLSDGAALLCCLGAAYLLKKRRKTLW